MSGLSEVMFSDILNVLLILKFAKYFVFASKWLCFGYKNDLILTWLLEF